MTAEIHTARCLCGKITLEATGPAKYMEYCHCKWCQQVSGSAFLPLIVFDRNNVKITSGALSYFQSSPNNQRGFCPDCGSTICFSSPRSFDIALGIMDNPEDFKAIRHIWTKSQISHVTIADNLPRFKESGS
ncbi:MAG: GFA family protein [Emcibacter sp.]|nr:GFA family protein [Emcibacter sp.]